MRINSPVVDVQVRRRLEYIISKLPATTVTVIRRLLYYYMTRVIYFSLQSAHNSI
jgi:hypothetical protein